MNCRLVRAFVLTLAWLGLALFGGAFVLAWLDPLHVERGARELLRIEVERRVGERIDALSNSRIAQLAERALARTDVDVAQSAAALRAGLSEKVAQVVADMLDADCACRQRLAAAMRTAALERHTSLLQLRERLTGAIEGAYATVSAHLLREFRIFTGSNAAAFGLLALVTLRRRGAALQLLLPAVILVGAVGVTGSLYLFRQDWLHTIVFGAYVGFAYTLYLAVVALLLADVLLNRARVTTRLVNVALNLIGSAATATPC